MGAHTSALQGPRDDLLSRRWKPRHPHIPALLAEVEHNPSRATARSGAPTYKFFHDSPRLWKCCTFSGDPDGRFVTASSRAPTNRATRRD